MKNADGHFLTMRDDGLITGTVASEEELQPGWHLMTELEYESLVSFIGESKLEPARRRA